MTNKNGANKPVKVPIRGVVYPSMSAAARALKVHISTIRGAIDTGRLDTVGLYLKPGNPSREARRSRRHTLRHARVTELTIAGKLPREIAASLGIDIRSVYYITSKARYSGLLPATRYSVRNRRKDTGYKVMARIAEVKKVKMGSYRAMVENLPTGVMHWITDQVPEGMSVAEFLSSIIIDTYHEEVGEEA